MNIPCRFSEIGCVHEAVAIYYIPKGCGCWDDPVQALCGQHFITADSDGPISLITELQGTER